MRLLPIEAADYAEFVLYTCGHYRPESLIEFQPVTAWSDPAGFRGSRLNLITIASAAELLDQSSS
jgi:hypothetical protein